MVKEWKVAMKRREDRAGKADRDGKGPEAQRVRREAEQTQADLETVEYEENK